MDLITREILRRELAADAAVVAAAVRHAICFLARGQQVCVLNS